MAATRKKKTDDALAVTTPAPVTLQETAKKWIVERDALVSEAKSIEKVESDTELDVSGGVQTSIQKHIKVIGKYRLDLTRPLDELKKQIMDQEKELVAPLETEITRIKRLNDAYATKLAQEAEAARQRAIEEQAQRAMDAAKEPEPESNPFGDEVVFEDEPIAPPVFIPAGPKTSNNRMVTRYEFQVIAPNQVPREYCTVDESKIREYIKLSIRLNREPEIPGVVFNKKISVEAR